MAALLSGAEIQGHLQSLPAWKLQGQAIVRTVALPSFPDAMSFVQAVGELAEDHGHHPDIDIRYTRITLTLSTHDAGGLTEKDMKLAAAIDALGPKSR